MLVKLRSTFHSLVAAESSATRTMVTFWTSSECLQRFDGMPGSLPEVHHVFEASEASWNELDWLRETLLAQGLDSLQLFFLDSLVNFAHLWFFWYLRFYVILSHLSDLTLVHTTLHQGSWSSGAAFEEARGLRSEWTLYSFCSVQRVC
jgi:hypothetical protein